jgi:predicted solute-binding protein
MGITINRKIVVKSIVTPELKEELIKQIDNSELQLRNQVDFLEKRLKEIKAENVKRDIKNEINKLNFQFQELERKRKEIESLKMGQEFYQGTVESPVEVELGDNLFEKLGKAEILVNNGEIVEFRNV